MKKTFIAFFIIALAAATFPSCQKESSRPSNSLNAGAVSNVGKTKYTGTSTLGDSTQTKTNP